MKTLVDNATIVNEGRTFNGYLIVEDDKIVEIGEVAKPPSAFYDLNIDASGCYVLPGVIDTHVHFREPGLTHKADIESESRAAAYGGVTSFFDMPNTLPQTTTFEALDDKFTRAARSSHVNYSFFFGATNDNVDDIKLLDKHKIPGVKLFMGSSTGNMLVDEDEALKRIFKNAPLPIVAHCEDTGIINDNMALAVKKWGEDPPVDLHPFVRSANACLASSKRAVCLAREYGARLHVAHVSTADELALLDSTHNETIPSITFEAVIAHLLFSEEDYASLGGEIKCNPAIKTRKDRDALRKALSDGKIFTIATDHAPHLPNEKKGGCRKAASGMPMVQFSLPCMLQLVDEGVLSLEKMVELMCHHPAMLFDVDGRGFIRQGYKADLVVVRKDAPWTVTKDIIQSKCGWSPLEGRRFDWRVEQTLCNGRMVYDRGRFHEEARGEAISFRSNR